MYRVVQRFNGLEEGKTFEVGDEYNFDSQRAEQLSALGYIVKSPRKRKSEQPSTDV